MIVIVGLPVATAGDGGIGPEGTAARAALAAAAGGSEVQLVGKVGDDLEGDAILFALTRGGVGHAAVLRDLSRRTPLVVAPLGDEADPFADVPSTPAAMPAATAPRPTLEAADIELALRYLSDFRCLVLAEPLPEAVVYAAAEAARYSAAVLIVVASAAVSPRWNLPAETLVLGPPDDDQDGVFARLLGDVAAAVDRGRSATAALEEVTAPLRARYRT